MRIPYDITSDSTINVYLPYYRLQAGNGLPFFAGSPYQRGGGFFSSLISRITPLIPSWFKTGASMLGRQALKTGFDIASDAAQSQSADEWRQKAKRRLKEGGGEFLTNVGRRLQTGEGIKRRRKAARRKQSVKRRTKQRTKQDFLGT